MAAKGSCTQSASAIGDVLEITWELTGDSSGDADGDTEALGPNFFTKVTGVIVGAYVTWTDATVSYDLYLKDSTGYDLLQGMGVDMAGDHTDGDHRFCPMVPTNITNFGVPIHLQNETVEAIGDDMGSGGVAALTLQIARVPDYKWR